jgi:small-conductance mechanosensitive channel
MSERQSQPLEPLGGSNLNGNVINSTHHIGLPILFLPGLIHFDNINILKYFVFVIIFCATLFLAWFIPIILRKIARDCMGWEIKITEKNIKKKLLALAMMQRQRQARAGGQSSSSRQYQDLVDAVDDEFKNTYHGCTGYLRKNVFLLIYLLVQVTIFIFGFYVSFSLTGQDLGLVFQSFGLIGLISLFQISIYLSHLFAHVSILLSDKFKEGDFIVVGGRSGVVAEIGLIFTTLYQLNPFFEQLELDEEYVRRLTRERTSTSPTQNSMPSIFTSSPMLNLIINNSGPNNTSGPMNTNPRNDGTTNAPLNSGGGGGRPTPKQLEAGMSGSSVHKHQPFVETLVEIHIPNSWFISQDVEIRHQ